MGPTNQPTTRARRGPVVVAVLGKGGSGKTTTAVTLADALQRRTGSAVQLLDLDAQGSATAWLLPGLDPDEPCVDDVLIGEAHLAGVVRRLRPGLTIVPAANGLAAVEPLLHPDALAHRVLLESSADVVVIDTPATRPLGPGAVILRAVLAAADVAVLPFRSTVLDLDAVDETIAQIHAHEQITGRDLPTLLLPTMVTSVTDVVVRALTLGTSERRGFEVLPKIPSSRWAEIAAGARALISERAPDGTPLLTAYDDVAAQLVPHLNGQHTGQHADPHP